MVLQKHMDFTKGVEIQNLSTKMTSISVKFYSPVINRYNYNTVQYTYYSIKEGLNTEKVATLGDVYK